MIEESRQFQADPVQADQPRSGEAGGGGAASASWLLGLMSGTSMDGVDAALLKSDGHRILALGPALTRPYDEETRTCLLRALQSPEDQGRVAEAERRITDAHAAVATALLDLPGPCPALIGFHGHTLWHRPEAGKTRQIGDGARLAGILGIPVIGDFRSADMREGGEGAPLAPLYHRARLAASLSEDDRKALPSGPVVILNLGGVANLTWIASRSPDARVMAFDTGPGCALIDDWVRSRTGAPFDDRGKLALSGRAEERHVQELFDHGFFARKPPKSLDRNTFSSEALGGLSAADGAATLVAFTARAVARALAFLPEVPTGCFVTGGGRHNPALMACLGDALGLPVRPVETLGWNGDSLESEAFAFLAARSQKGLPLSLPETTGVRRPVRGGVRFAPGGASMNVAPTS